MDEKETLKEEIIKMVNQIQDNEMLENIFNITNAISFFEEEGIEIMNCVRFNDKKFLENLHILSEALLYFYELSMKKENTEDMNVKPNF